MAAIEWWSGPFRNSRTRKRCFLGMACLPQDYLGDEGAGSAVAIRSPAVNLALEGQTQLVGIVGVHELYDAETFEGGAFRRGPNDDAGLPEVGGLLLKA